MGCYVNKLFPKRSKFSKLKRKEKSQTN